MKQHETTMVISIRRIFGGFSEQLLASFRSLSNHIEPQAQFFSSKLHVRPMALVWLRQIIWSNLFNYCLANMYIYIDIVWYNYIIHTDIYIECLCVWTIWRDVKLVSFAGGPWALGRHGPTKTHPSCCANVPAIFESWWDVANSRTTMQFFNENHIRFFELSII